MQRFAPLATLLLLACGHDRTPLTPVAPWPSPGVIPDAGPSTVRIPDAGPSSFGIPDAGFRDAGRAAGCGDVTPGGRCDAIDLITFCDTETVGEPIVRYRFCAKGERCQTTTLGAECQPTGACREGESRCRTSQDLESCQGGRWVSQRCPRTCNAGNALGAFCDQAIESRVVNGTANYEARPPNADYTGWGEKRVIQAAFFTVLSVVDRGEELEAFDAAVADDAGRFSIKVPAASPSLLVLVAAGFGPNGELQFVVASPGFGRSAQEEPHTVGANPRVWMWATPTPAAGTPVNLVAREENGSGAAHVALYLQVAFRRAAILHPGRPAPSIVAWVEMGTSWDCGSCFSSAGTTAFSKRFATQMWIGAGSNGRSYWSDAVVAHELGHWHMDGFGTSPNEGGKHRLGVPTFPGQAWSEGWATFYSSDVRDDPRYFSQQSGSFFWLNEAASRQLAEAVRRS